jgi:hypothetical protein
MRRDCREREWVTVLMCLRALRRDRFGANAYAGADDARDADDDGQRQAYRLGAAKRMSFKKPIRKEPRGQADERVEEQQ